MKIYLVQSQPVASKCQCFLCWTTYVRVGSASLARRMFRAYSRRSKERLTWRIIKRVETEVKP